MKLNHRILFVDDEQSILSAVGEYFAALGFRVDCANEREEAEALLANVSYSVVVSDLRLSGFMAADGLEIISFIRERSPATKIVLLTAYGSPELEKEALRLGVGSILRKPQPLAHLAKVIFGLLGESDERRNAAGTDSRP